MVSARLLEGDAVGYAVGYPGSGQRQLDYRDDGVSSDVSGGTHTLFACHEP